MQQKKDYDSILNYPLRTTQIIAPSIVGETEGFIPLLARNLVADQPVPFNIYLKIIAKKKSDPKPEYIICCPKGQVFLEKWRAKLLRLKNPWIYYSARDDAVVLNYLNDNINAFITSDHIHKVEKIGLIYDMTLVWTRNFFLTWENRSEEKLYMAVQYIAHLFEFMRSYKMNIEFLLDIFRHDSYLYSHSLNVCLLGMVFVNFIGFKPLESRAFALGALLHDIGMTTVPIDILQKTGVLKSEEKEIIRKHPSAGFKILKQYSSLWWEAMLMAAQHHENGDGSGYPEGLVEETIHPWARILRIVDSFESVTSPRPWRPAKSPNEALLDMRTEWMQCRVYDGKYLKEFIKFLGGSGKEEKCEKPQFNGP